MWTKHVRPWGLLMLVCGFMAGCKPSQATPPESGASLNDPVVTTHWVGIKHLSRDPSAAGFLKFWRLPESERLKMQTLDKLAAAPWRLASTNRPAITNAAAYLREYPSAALLRPLLDDLVQDEWFFETREAADHTVQAALAVRLEPGHAGVWETNLASVLEKATRSRRAASRSGTPHSWETTNSTPSVHPLLRHVEFSHVGDWTIVGLGGKQNQAASNLVNRIQKGQSPAQLSTTNSWLETVFDLRRVNRLLSMEWDLPEDWPRVLLAFSGNGQEVLTRGLFSFAKPLPFQIEPWNIPTNLVHEPLHSFTAVQGIQHWLSSWSWWQKAHPPSTPNQIFAWGQSGSPFLDYAAAPVPDGRKDIAKLGPALIDTMNPMLVSNRMGKWEKSPSADGVEWHAPVIAPFVQSLRGGEGNWLLAGLSPFGLTNGAPPLGTFKELQTQRNVVFYSREITGPRIEAWLYIGQIFRIILRRAQLPPEARSIAWLKAIAPSLGNSTTFITKTGPGTMSLSRESSLGLSAFEIHVLVDWLESQDFPLRAHSLVAKLRAPPEEPLPSAKTK
jgi:hypothetical protein